MKLSQSSSPFFMTLILIWGSLAGMHDSHAQYREVTDWKKTEKELPPKPGCTVEIKETQTVEGTLDGKGCLYIWKGAGSPQKCHAASELSETEPRMFVLAKGATLRNMHIECSLDGILMNDDTLVENIVVRDCEEDCITTKGANNTIRNNQFYLCQDKCIQMNKASNVLIENNYFRHASRPMSGSGKIGGGATGIQAINNRCYNCEIMIRAQRNHDVTARGNTLEYGRDLFETVEDAVIYDCGGNTVNHARLRSRKGTDQIRPCGESI